jgi:hypothetical protein
VCWVAGMEPCTLTKGNNKVEEALEGGVDDWSHRRKYNGRHEPKIDAEVDCLPALELRYLDRCRGLAVGARKEDSTSYFQSLEWKSRFSEP